MIDTRYLPDCVPELEGIGEAHHCSQYCRQGNWSIAASSGFNGGNNNFLSVSADWMLRNLNDRIELFFPVKRAENILSRIKRDS